MSNSKTLYDKLFDSHIVSQETDGTVLLYIDRHLTHEVTSPQAFEGLELAGRPLWRNNSNFSVVDHNVPTTGRHQGVKDPISKIQIDTLDVNAKKYKIAYFDLLDQRQGIVHVVGPEQGLTLPGMTLVCGDSHTSTHGALASLAFGIGTSEVEHVMATQCLITRKAKNMLVRLTGKLSEYVSSKDLALFLIGKIGTAGGTGYAIEFAGEAVEKLSMEARMTLCNMAIEAGARSGMVAFDQVTEDYVKSKPLAPQGDAFEAALKYWRTLKSDPNAHFDQSIEIDVSAVEPQVTWGTSPELVVGVNGTVPDPQAIADLNQRASVEKALTYMGLSPNIKITDIQVDKVFIGSCTNSRIEDLRIAANLVKGRQKASHVKQVLIVPGSGLVKAQAEKEGLDQIFKDAGFEWREPGCSMCLGMNEDQLSPGERCASTSNRNFEGRQGPGGRTHLVSPAMAACAAIAGHFVDVRSFNG
ncbi:3-isopropylmalate dehydratase large subunit [Polynucleobacter sp. 30F-ANTBAC]|jgi:3-isopropylmalate/(R)-2-methylmalate dehydratase large subunit|uniref:3-isopropylmalate dehydratase large subunit n=1 Tax=Polynucleobacter sp. 30F-ANTBAC TaxID=2689095 RepID=UPI001C0D1FE8|nr:3-isopropylmalate dehydratase large subunit [Polynucleobacter sp. 30F-ANTBAC]MBU3599260.1 3-isopropylmalate dehydratase large subunit [Polynucleobacter sp. 30F-ANTBAC]